MNVEQLAINAINKIKTTWGLPQSGFIAGGSIANLIWEEVSGNKAVINDIDVFVFDGLLDKFEVNKNESLYSYSKKEDIWFEDYNGIAFMTKDKDYYSIVESSKKDIFNIIKYKSNTDNPKIVIDSFDINCTAIGYSIDNDEFYWTPDFEKFLETGNLQICNIKTPSHTAIRIVKKQSELNAYLSDFEFNILQHTLIPDSNLNPYKVRFQERYLDLFVKYIDKMSEFFYIEKDMECINFVKFSHAKDVKLWKLISNKRVVFKDENLSSIRSDNFLFYIRNIYGKEELSKIWKSLSCFYDDFDYVDQKVSDDDIGLLGRFVHFAPDSIKNLKGLKLSEQINLIKNLFEVYKEDPLIAISVLERNKLDKDIVIDIQTKLLLELSVRKDIVEDYRDKVNKILYPIKKKKENIDNKLFTI